MKLTNMELSHIEAPMRELGQLTLPVKPLFQVVKLVKVLAEHLNTLNQTRDKLVTQYGKPDPLHHNMPGIKPGDENWPAFNVALGELYREEIEIDIKPVELPNTIQLKPATLIALERFIKIAE